MKSVISVLMEMRVRTKMLTLEREPIEMLNPMNSLWNVCVAVYFCVSGDSRTLKLAVAPVAPRKHAAKLKWELNDFLWS